MNKLYPNINNNLMTQNNKEVRLGVAPQVELEKELPRKKKYSVDSFFVIGRVEEGEHKINYLFHIIGINMPLPLPGNHAMWEIGYSILDETDGTYITGEKFCKDKQAKIDEKKFLLKFEDAQMSGDWDKMHIYLKADDFEIDTEAVSVHYPLFTRGSAVFDMFGMVIHQFSVPYMKTTGSLTLKGKKYELNGENACSWFDRQWQMQNFKITTQWTWMAIYLENGDVLSIMSADGETDTPQFMTAMKTDGSLVHSTNFKSFHEYEKRQWVSEKTKQKYGTLWELELSDFDAKLCIDPIIEKQEIVSKVNNYSRYEGSASVSGIYEGKPITGRATVEILKI